VVVLAAGPSLVPCFVIPIFIGLAIVAILSERKRARRVRLGSREYESQEAFREKLGAELGLWGTKGGAGDGPLPVQFSGTLAGGTRAHVGFSVAPGKGPLYYVHLAVAADEAPSLVVTREDAMSWFAKAIGLKHEIEVGDKAFDAHYLLETEDPRAAKALGAVALREEIDEIFSYSGVERLELGKGSLVVTARAEPLNGVAMKELLALLAAVARLVARVPITVRILGGERRALVGASGQARCGYCHEDVTGEEPDLVACDHCRTVAHAECWVELGRCPVIGCPGRAPERGRASQEGTGA
jgi:hypothetical protein